MKLQSLTGDEARLVAHRAGVCQALVSQAVDRNREIGVPISAYRVCLGGPRLKGPPSSVMLIAFCYGAQDPQDNGWTGVIYRDVTNQRELNAAEAGIKELIAEFYRANGHDPKEAGL